MQEIINYLNSIRRDFSGKELDVNSVKEDPIQQLALWLEEAANAQVPDPNAMNLATVSAEGKPSSRIVLLRGIDDGDLVFYTNYKSHKGQELSQNAHAAINFFWVELDRQIRFQGKVSRVSDAISDKYFASRPRESQIGAWASEQSNQLTSRKELEENFEKFKKEFEGKEVPRPPHWGGFRFSPDLIEFWQGRPNRLHDRLVYQLTEKKDWEISRLSP